MRPDLLPKSVQYLSSGYSWPTFRKDLLAGLTVGVIALPLAMAFAIASGVSPEKGLFTAVVAGFLISALGGSRVQIGGPTGAFVVLVYGIIQKSGYEGLAMATLVAAFLLIVFGLFRLGSFIQHVPHALVTGFTTGLALLIFSAQVRDFFGFSIQQMPVGFIEKWMVYAKAIGTCRLPTLFLGCASLGIIVFMRRFFPKLPWGIMAIALVAIVTYFFHLPVATIRTNFGLIPSSLPIPSLPALHWNGSILIDGIAIALLAGIESLLSAVIGDRVLGSKHRPNAELIGQGVANFASVMFGGIPATGAIARTVANIKTGAQTPMAGMVHAVTLLGVMIYLAPLVSEIPLAALSAVLMVIAWNMAELPYFLRLLKGARSEVAVLLTAFFLTVFVDITAAIIGGMLLSMILKRVSAKEENVPPPT